MSEGWAEITADIDKVFSYSEEERPQNRAHAYLERRKVARGFRDTAMQCAATDMARRAYDAGRRDELAGLPEARRTAATLTRVAGELLETACELRGAGGAE